MTRQFNPKETEFEGCLAYIVPKGIELGNRIEINVYGIKLNLDITKLKAPFKREAQVEEGENSKSETQAEIYMPNIKSGRAFDVRLNPTCVKYKLIYLHDDIESNFPGYKVPFEIRYHSRGGIKTIVTYVTSAKSGTKVGEYAGSYFSKGLGELYRDHPELNEKSKIRFRVIEPGKSYEIIRFTVPKENSS